MLLADRNLERQQIARPPILVVIPIPPQHADRCRILRFRRTTDAGRSLGPTAISNDLARSYTFFILN
jgi:hypothetical protein